MKVHVYHLPFLLYILSYLLYLADNDFFSHFPSILLEYNLENIIHTFYIAFPY